jgi:hypothetical protein
MNKRIIPLTNKFQFWFEWNQELDKNILVQEEELALGLGKFSLRFWSPFL